MKCVRREGLPASAARRARRPGAARGVAFRKGWGVVLAGPSGVPAAACVKEEDDDEGFNGPTVEEHGLRLGDERPRNVSKG